MAGIKRTVKTCAKRKSMQPFWIISLVLICLLFHLMFDARRLFMVKFQGSQITINVANYNLQGKYESLLFQQVRSGDKPVFVLRERMSGVELDTEGGISWTSVNYPRLYDYQSFAELPTFTKAVCRKDSGSFIPNIVHYVWFGKLDMTFLQYLSMRSAATVQKPTSIVLHTDGGEPEGKYWESLRREAPCLEVRYIAKPTKLFGKYPLTNVQQQSHIARLRVLFEEGGIYADMNVIFVRPFDELMNKSLILGREEDEYYSNSVILAERGAAFITMWFIAYSRRIVDWSTYSMYIPYRLHRENPRVPFDVEEYSMARPNFNEDEWITTKNWALEDSYCVHLYSNRERIKMILKKSPLDIINIDNTLGQLTRIALFGRPYLRESEMRFRSLVHSKLKCGTSSPHNSDSIPNIIHYVVMDVYTHKHYLSVRSAVRSIKPTAVYFHLLSNKEPDNYFWVRTLLEIDCVTVQYLSEKDNFTKDTQSKVFITKILNDYGGIYLSYDVIVTSSFQDFLRSHVAMGRNTASSGEIDVLLSMKNSKFLSEWILWDKSDNEVVKKKIEKYTEVNPTEVIKVVEDFPLVPSVKGWKYFTEEYQNFKCFLVTKRDTKIDFESDTMYDILQSDTFSGKIARIAHFGNLEIRIQ